MTSVDTGQDQAVLRTLDFDAELPCESEHQDHRNLVCAGRATHVAKFICDGQTLLGCKNFAAYAKESIASDQAVCAECGRSCSECWSIRPI